jgi:Yip1 domain
MTLDRDMTATSSSIPASPASLTSIREKLFNIFVSPTDVFDEVIATPRNLANWRIPTLLACLVSIISLQLANSPGQSSATIHRLTEAGAISSAQAHALAGAWPLLSALLVCIATFAGTCWSAFVLWFIGRIFLKVRFAYTKTLEIVGLTAIISALCSIMTILLVAASGNPAARPALSVLADKLDHSRALYQILETLNFFYLWSTTIMAIGLSRLCNVTFKEAAFWVFGYWMFTRIVLIVLQ